MTQTSPRKVDLMVIGNGQVGSSIAHHATFCEGIADILVIDKNQTPGGTNSRSSQNSQTLHEGNIETNTTEKKRKDLLVSTAMSKKYMQNKISLADAPGIYKFQNKMLLGAGKDAQYVRDRFETIKQYYPDDRLVEEPELESIEPLIMKGRHSYGDIVAHFSPNGYTIDYGNLAQHILGEAKARKGDLLNVLQGVGVEEIIRQGDEMLVTLDNGEQVLAKYVVAATGSRTVKVIKDYYKNNNHETIIEGDGSIDMTPKDYIMLSILSHFYMSKEKRLNSKVYLKNPPIIPYARPHGDPEITTGLTRWGPTAYPGFVFEKGKWSEAWDYMKTIEYGPRTLSALMKLFSKEHWTIGKYLLNNLGYNLPGGKQRFVKELQYICPTIQADDIEDMKEHKGTRLQQLLLVKPGGLVFGEGVSTTQDGRLVGISSPSPGATDAFGMGQRIWKKISKLSGGKVQYNEEMFNEYLNKKIQ